MSPHYERQDNRASTAGPATSPLGGGPDGEAMEEAGEALREAEVEAAQPEISNLNSAQLEHMSIDELRAAANALDVPDRAQIIEQDELIAAIRRFL